MSRIFFNGWRMAEKVTIGNAELWLGNCREVLPQIGRVEAVLLDPPYGVDLGSAPSATLPGLKKQAYASTADSIDAWKAEVAPLIEQSIDAGKRAAVFGSNNVWHLRKPTVIGGVYLPAAMGRNGWGFTSLATVAFYGAAPDPFRRPRATVKVSTARAEDVDHPCPKPTEWMLWLVDLSSRPGETVLDSFMGSGTTGVACAMLHRRFIGIEKERKYFDIACERIARAQAQGQLLPPEQKPAAVQDALF